MKQTTGTVRVNEAAHLRDLARAVIAQSVRDLKNKKQPARALDALFWLTDPASDFGLWCDMLELQLDPFKMLVSGGARRLKGKAE